MCHDGSFHFQEDWSDFGEYWQLKCVWAETWEQVGSHQVEILCGRTPILKAQCEQGYGAEKVHLCQLLAWNFEGMGPRRKGESLSWLAGKVDCVLDDSWGSEMILFLREKKQKQNEL